MMLLAVALGLAGCSGGGSVSNAVPRASQTAQMPTLGSSSGLKVSLSGRTGTQSGWGGTTSAMIALSSASAVSGYVDQTGISADSSSRAVAGGSASPSPSATSAPAPFVVVVAYKGTNTSGWSNIAGWAITNPGGQFQLYLPAGTFTLVAYLQSH